MEGSKQAKRTQVAAWNTCDVNDLYETIAKVGSGTYGEVDKARVRGSPNQIVALKKIKDASETEGFPITALREINLLQQCDHPNIVKLYNVVTSKSPQSNTKSNKGSTYLVFEYMEHELLGYIETCHLNPAQVKCIIKQTLEGLDYLHSNHIIHRDIKSANILVNNRGEVKIADFGLAKHVNPNVSGKLTQRVVTRWYRAPELLLGCKKYTNKIDMWALGCVFAELLIGRSQALFPAQKTPDQFELICEKCGTPDENLWPEYKTLPNFAQMAPRRHFPRVLTQYMCRQKANMDTFALDLLEKMLCYNPEERITAKEALNHPYFHSYPLACSPLELPKVDQDCHTYIINNKRKGTYKTLENNKPNNQYTSNKAPLKQRNIPVQVPVPNPGPVTVPVPVAPRNNQFPQNVAPVGYQYNNYQNVSQVNHIDNINNINVNLFFPPTNTMLAPGNFYNISNISFGQQIPYLNQPNPVEPLNNNVYIQPKQLEQGILFNPNMNMVPLSNNTMMQNFNPYPYFNGMQTANNTTYVEPPKIYPQYNQGQNMYSTLNFGNEQVQSLERSYYAMQDLCRRENQQLLKRRATTSIEEFEIMDPKKRHLVDLVQPNN